MNKLLNNALRAKGYAGLDIKMVLTDVTDSNGPYYTDTLTNTVVFDRKKLANSNRNEILNALGHEFGHYSKEDNKTGNQTIANYSGDKLEARTKAMVSKEATKETLASIRNNPNVITGEEGKKLAESIPMERREYVTYSESGSIGGALFGAGGIGYTTYKCFDYKNNKIQVVKVIEGEVGQGAPFDIGVSLSLGWYPGINSFDEFGDYTIAKGGSIDPVWVATRGQKNIGYTIGTDFIKNDKEKYIGIKFSIGKSLKNFDLHEKNTVYSNILSREIYTIYDYYEKFYPRGGRNSWKSK
ncbi:hemolysin [Fusobacterium nucleatum]|uniref:hemolysin n=1 Tax=Fusobacterium nucleatum TaxID=851 RepID=UPI002361AC0D|nr:hemolysin [Fusobacterium nucleatum]WDA46518.1 hemolysin [Fusobacterium nucleatum]